jgi:hypothetical protein
MAKLDLQRTMQKRSNGIKSQQTMATDTHSSTSDGHTNMVKESRKTYILHYNGTKNPLHKDMPQRNTKSDKHINMAPSD